MFPTDKLECGDPVKHYEHGEGFVSGLTTGADKMITEVRVMFRTLHKAFAWSEECLNFEKLAYKPDFAQYYRETKALEDVIEERVLQDRKWGEQNHDIFLYLAILGEEYGETCQAALEARFSKNREKALEHLREEAVQTAAVALAIVECLDRKKWAWGSHAEKS